MESGDEDLREERLLIDPVRYGAAVASLYETVLDQEKWGTALAHVASVFDAPNAALFNYNFSQGVTTNFRGLGLDPDVAIRYANYYHRLDPGRPVAMAAAVGEWLSDEPLLDLRSRANQEYVHDFAIRSGLGRLAGCKVAGDEDSCLYLSLGRPPGGKRFGDEARSRYRALEPHFQRVNALQAKVEALTLSNSIAVASLNRLRVGVMVTDSQSKVRLINDYAVRLLGPTTGLGTTHGQLKCADPADNDRLRRLVAMACAQPFSGGAMRLRTAPRSDPAHLIVLPIADRHELATLHNAPAALIMITNQSSGGIQLDALRNIYGLTSAEAALLTELAKGLSVTEIAELRGVAVATVRTQLRAAFDKTSTDTQSRLVALAKSMPPAT